MIIETIFTATVLCSSLIPINTGVLESKYLLSQVAPLSHGMIYRKWDLDLDGHADVMTGHEIDPTQIERYKQLFERGTDFNVRFGGTPLLYWVDFTGTDSWDRIYVDKLGNRQCELFARKDTDA